MEVPLMTATTRTAHHSAVWLSEMDCDLDEFVAIVEQATDPLDYPHAASIDRGVVIYDSNHLREAAATPAGRRAVQAEIVHAFLDGPGIAVFRQAFADHAAIDRASNAFWAMIADQHARGATAGDHYAVPGANDRVWNVSEKFALADPDGFAAYYSNDSVDLASGAWLGPGYQVTCQVNVVNPGGAAQSPHRDYHLGFMTNEVAEEFPVHAHRLSPALTLQGAVAHCDMPVVTGPTMYLPHSQKYLAGFLAWRRPEFKEYFARHYVQLALHKGDAVFFNPALFHAAGHNQSLDVKRMANLFQVSSPFGRAMESVDRLAMSKAVYPSLVKMRTGGATNASLHHVIAACSEGYAFPTNLDRDQPVKGLAPETQAETVWRALVEEWDAARLSTELDDHATRRSTSG